MMLVTSSVLKDSVLGPFLFSVFINDFNKEMESTLTKFADNYKLGWNVDLLEGRNTSQGPAHAGSVG